MKKIAAKLIEDRIAQELIDINILMSKEMKEALENSLKTEESPVGKDILEELLLNGKIACENKIPICQDTGTTVFFVELGEEVEITGGSIYEAINNGVRKGYTDGYLRKSMVLDPLFNRENTGDNTPAIIYLDLVPGAELRISFGAKGGGSENMSQVKMLRPADGVEGLKKFVLDVVESAGPNPCPPLIIGIGVGGTMEKAAQLSKKVLFRSMTEENPDPQLAQLEKEILEEVNSLGVGPMGLGGTTTALRVHIGIYPCHIASLPVAVNLNCHASRHGEIVL